MVSTESCYRLRYPDDLTVVQRRSLSGRAISICSFVPDYPDVPAFRDPALAIRGLDDKQSFTLAVFWEVLADQASYTVRRKDFEPTPGRPSVPKLVGLLATFHNNVHPGYLLIALSFSIRTPQLIDTLAQQLQQIGEDCLTELTPRLSDDWQQVGSCMSSSLSPTMRPDSIRAYVPHGDQYRLSPNMGAVDELCSRAKAVISSFAGLHC